MAETLIYRAVDVRALDDFHAGDDGLSVDAERVWMRLLIDRDLSTVVPGLVLAGKAQIAERCRMKPATFAAAWKELEEDGKVKADWPKGVVILPAAPGLDVHDPKGTNKVVEWARFFVRSAPKSALVDALREAWRVRLDAKGGGWLQAFDSLSRGAYSKPSPNDPPNASANGSPNISPNVSAKHSDPHSGALSQESGVRSQEEKPPPAREEHVEAPEGYDRRRLNADWERLVGSPAGDGVQVEALLALLVRFAALRQVAPGALAAHVLPSVRPVVEAWTPKGGRRWTPSAGLVADEKHGGKAFGEVLDHADRRAGAAAPSGLGRATTPASEPHGAAYQLSPIVAARRAREAAEREAVEAEAVKVAR